MSIVTCRLKPYLTDLSSVFFYLEGESDPTGGGCSNEDTTISGCSSASPNITDDTKFNFIFDECMTPSISSIDPLIGDSSDTIVIEGSGFSDEDCANVITVGQYPCVTTSSSLRHWVWNVKLILRMRWRYVHYCFIHRSAESIVWFYLG